uniref:Putative type 1 non-specific lipid transfer protein n=1 Tax=Wolffia arrhiza TaxID=161111 RepID=F1BX95_WOLAR|nr:putative type 1 non-specific lipid transfer protein precursor [Wolffia arrhiza]AEQ39039.1 putative type 1 non-specific lipid transfer protein precursor [Wolffia arrhiza]
MAGKGATLLFVSAFAFLLLTAPYAGGQITCTNARSNVAQCLGYLVGRVASPPAPCCDGVRRLNSLAGNSTRVAIRAACLCLQGDARKLKALNANRISGIVSNCGVSPPFPISANITCPTA